MPRKPNYPENPTKLAKYIIARLEQSGITANDLAAETGISQTHLSDILHGKQSPKAPILNKLADHFKVSRLALYEVVGWVKLDDKETILFLLDKLSENDTAIADLKKTIGNEKDQSVQSQYINYFRSGLAELAKTLQQTNICKEQF